jgi:hypothetical protein
MRLGLHQCAKNELENCTMCAFGIMAYCYDRAGEPDSALAYYEQYVTTSRCPACAGLSRLSCRVNGSGEDTGSGFLAQFDEALAVLERDYEARGPLLPWVNTNPLFEGMRLDPRFQDLLRRLNF